MDSQILGKVAMFYVPFLFALCFHEFAHGWVAKKLGDITAESLGRVSMNPLVHMDLFGTVIFPIVAIVSGSPLFFGWAKPVPVSVSNLRNPKKDMFWIAFAGPLSNLFLAIVGLFLLGFKGLFIPAQYHDVFVQATQMFVILNLFLAVFNLIPVHPLDGGKILARFLPPRINYWLEQNAGMLSMVLFAVIIIDSMNGGGSFISKPVYFLYNVFAYIVSKFFMLFSLI